MTALSWLHHVEKYRVIRYALYVYLLEAPLRSATLIVLRTQFILSLLENH